MSFRLALTGLAAIALFSSPAGGVGKSNDERWGRAGISFDQYRADALECGNRAYGVPVAMRPCGPVAMTFGVGAAVVPPGVWTSLTPGRVPFYSSTYSEGYRHAAWMDVVEQLQSVVDACLVERGYQRFRLSAAQMRTLRRLEPGAAERQLYLHRLGSGGRILSRQSIPERRRLDPSGRAGQS